RMEKSGDQESLRRGAQTAGRTSRGSGLGIRDLGFEKLKTGSRDTPESRELRELRAESRIPNPESQWFAIWTRSRHEQVVRDQLERKRFEAFLPTITRWSRWKDRKKKIDWPLFPGYCFARFNGEDTLPILKCTGVVSIVSFEGKPAPIPEYELDSIRLLIGSELQYDPCPLIK